MKPAKIPSACRACGCPPPAFGFPVLRAHSESVNIASPSPSLWRRRARPWRPAPASSDRRLNQTASRCPPMSPGRDPVGVADPSGPQRPTRLELWPSCGESESAQGALPSTRSRSPSCCSIQPAQCRSPSPLSESGVCFECHMPQHRSHSGRVINRHGDPFASDGSVDPAPGARPAEHLVSHGSDVWWSPHHG